MHSQRITKHVELSVLEQQLTLGDVRVYMCMHCQPQLLVKCRQRRRLQYKRPTLHTAHPYVQNYWQLVFLWLTTSWAGHR